MQKKQKIKKNIIDFRVKLRYNIDMGPGGCHFLIQNDWQPSAKMSFLLFSFENENAKNNNKIGKNAEIKIKLYIYDTKK